jgi:hypothetical protein
MTARAVPARLLPGAIGAHRILAHRMREGQAADRAPGRREKGHPGPTAAAQRLRLVDDRAAGEAARRQDAVDDGTADPPQLGRKGCRKLHRL